MPGDARLCQGSTRPSSGGRKWRYVIRYDGDTKSHGRHPGRRSSKYYRVADILFERRMWAFDEGPGPTGEDRSPYDRLLFLAGRSGTWVGDLLRWRAFFEGVALQDDEVALQSLFVGCGGLGRLDFVFGISGGASVTRGIISRFKCGHHSGISP